MLSRTTFYKQKLLLLQAYTPKALPQKSAYIQKLGDTLMLKKITPNRSFIPQFWTLVIRLVQERSSSTSSDLVFDDRHMFCTGQIYRAHATWLFLPQFLTIDDTRFAHTGFFGHMFGARRTYLAFWPFDMRFAQEKLTGHKTNHNLTADDRHAFRAGKL